MNINLNYNYIEEIALILDQNIDKRICVVGTSCTGKTTYLEHSKNGLDMDKVIFPLLSEKEKAYICQTPWTPKIGETMNKLVKEQIKIKRGQPVFGTVIIDCDMLVYLNISDNLLEERTINRKVNYADAKNMKNSIEKELKNLKIPVIIIEVK